MLSPSTQKRQISFQLYKLKKNKQPDHLLSLISKSKKQQQNLQLSQNQSLDSKVRQAIRRHMIEKRVSNILNHNTRNVNLPVSEKNNFKDKSNAIISQPVKCLQKPWIPPIQKQVLEKKFSQQQLVLQAKRTQQRLILNNKTQLTQLLNTINLNKKMLFFGNYLSSQFDSKNNTNRKSISLASIPKTKQSKLSFLESRYKQLVSNVNKRPKLFVMNSVVQEEKGFFNPLQHDQYYGTIMKVQDKELMKILVKALEEQGRFTLTSFTRFYEIFVWQSATRQDLTKFAAKILMLDKDQLSITDISIRIDEICQKINLQQLNHSLENFSQIMKKLLFGEEFVFALKNEYFLTRKALIQSLQRNQQCISIFINVFYV